MHKFADFGKNGDYYGKRFNKINCNRPGWYIIKQ